MKAEANYAELATASFQSVSSCVTAEAAHCNSNAADLLAAGVRSHARALQPLESLFFQGDCLDRVYRLQRGWAFRYQSLEDGRRQIVDFILPGDLVGFEELDLMPYGVEALTPCVFTSYGRSEFSMCLHDDPTQSIQLIKMLCAIQNRSFDHLTNVGRRTARERVAHLLLELIQRVRRISSVEGRLRMTLPLIQQHLGDALGLASETVCRCLSEMRKKGILVLRAGRLDVLDIDALAEEAGILLDEESEDRCMPTRSRVAA
jgi:CRP-like cAMP-binding protein